MMANTTVFGVVYEKIDKIVVCVCVCVSVYKRMAWGPNMIYTRGRRDCIVMV